MFLVSPSTTQSGCFTPSPSCFLPGWLCLTPSQTPTPSSTSLCLSFSRTSLSFSSHTFLSCSLLRPILFLGPPADLHFLRICLLCYTIPSHLSGSFSCSPFPLLLLFTKGFPRLFSSPLLFLYHHFVSFLWSLQVSGRHFIIIQSFVLSNALPVCTTEFESP